MLDLYANNNTCFTYNLYDDIVVDIPVATTAAPLKSK